MTTIALWLIVVLAVLAVWHFLWEAILAPSLRVKLRFRVFTIRDTVIDLQAEGLRGASAEVLSYLQDSLRNTLRIMPYLSFVLLYEGMQALERDEGLRERSRKRREALEACPDERVHKAVQALDDVIIRALIINSGAWAIYLIPPALFLACWRRIEGLMKAIVATPEGELEKYGGPCGCGLVAQA